MATDLVSRSQAGRVVDEVIDGTDHYPEGANSAYDAAGRLVAARVPGHTLTYDYEDNGASCDLDPEIAGFNSNRAQMVDNAVTTTYCYDEGDRLLSSSDAAVGTPVYNDHGNTTTLGDQTLVYDGADRHMSTAVSGGPTVTYVRDATDRIIRRGDGTTTTRYGFSAPATAPRPS